MKKVYIIAIVLAVLSGTLLFLYLGNLESSSGPTIETEAVVTAVRDIPAYTTIDGTMLTITNVPKGAAHPKAARDVAEVVGKTTDGAIITGEQILTAKLNTEESALSYIVPKGMRAITISVDEVTGIAGFIKTGDYVDVMSTTTTDYSKESTTTLVIVQDVKVVALDKKTVSAKSEDGSLTAATYTYITLIVTPQQSVRIAHGYASGPLFVVLRSFGDHTAEGFQPVANNDF